MVVDINCLKFLEFPEDKGKMFVRNFLDTREIIVFCIWKYQIWLRVN